MQLGFVSAILSDFSLDDVFSFASDEGFACVEVMCWPPGAAERRYAGVTHIDITNLNEALVGKVLGLVDRTGVRISGLGYYPNPLHPEPEHRHRVLEHLRTVIQAAPRLGVDVVNTFIGRDWRKSVPENWQVFDGVWPPLALFAHGLGVKIGIENCPMLFSLDEWPGGANLASTPAIWNVLFEKAPTLGLNFDPSHLIWQHVDVGRAIREFGKRFVHVHAKDTRLDRDSIYQHGVTGLGWHTPKIPGLGDVNWSAFFSALTDTGYHGAVCIEVEDRAFEGSLAMRIRSLRQSKRFLEQFM
ncbi:MAG: sugar phosphate isomerase/epimerase [Planctomycetes bacterium]|jgi:sugar phosphate isomerase/epimerase|nr:sugar phosphate isomerase/epimerase [Planctomycetota bacterium]